MEVYILKEGPEIDNKDIPRPIPSDRYFVADTHLALYEYLEKLELKGSQQYQLKICKEINHLNAEFRCGEHIERIDKISDLLMMIGKYGGGYVVVKGDADTADDKVKKEVRSRLIEIMQQMLYVGISLEKVHILTEKEFIDIERLSQFERSLPQREDGVRKSIESVKSIADDPDHHRDNILTSLQKINELIAEAKNNELKIAVAASKKSGKSVVVNSIIEHELAPTSLELATPNTCIYHHNSDGFTLDYKGKRYNFASEQDMRNYIFKEFKNAEMNKADGYGIADMEIGYTGRNNGFTSYRIYDTPGPDLAGATEHKNTAYQAIDEADVLIFAIDYSKYLTDSEFEYLEDIKKLCIEKGKNYSLILVVNKLDLRYESSENDKSVVRILDFIKQKLIRNDSYFKDCIVIGTSALTYFNAIAAPKIEGCENLIGKNGFVDNLKECIDDFAYNENDGSIMAILDQLDNTVNRAKRFHKETLANLEDIKRFSGFQNLLSYVSYIATNKARNEKLNNIMYQIDAERCAIENIFHFNELEIALSNNQDKLNEAKRILSEFAHNVNSIFDIHYPEIYPNAKNNNIRSEILRKLSSNRDFILKDIVTECGNILDSSFDLESHIKTYAGQTLPMIIKGKLEVAYNWSTETRKAYKEGKEVKVLDTQKVYEVYCDAVSDNELNQELTSYLNTQSENVRKKFDGSFNDIKIDLEFVMNQRIDKLDFEIAKCGTRLNEQCSIQLKMEKPEFKFTLPQTGSIAELKGSIISNGIKSHFYDEINNNTLYEKNSRYIASQKEKYKKQVATDWQSGDYLNALSNAGGFVSTVFEKIGNSSQRKENNMTQEEAGTLYRKFDFKSKIVGCVMTSPVVERKFKEVKESYKNMAQGIVDSFEEQVDRVKSDADNIYARTVSILDRTSDYQKYIDQLEAEKRVLEVLKEAVQAFSSAWS